MAENCCPNGKKKISVTNSLTLTTSLSVTKLKRSQLGVTKYSGHMTAFIPIIS